MKKEFIMNEALKNKASKNFDKYLNEFINYGKVNGLPVTRLSKSEWDELNKFLQPIGVVLVQRTLKGNMYMWFSKLQRMNTKQQSLKNAKEQLNKKIFAQIKSKYPNISDNVIMDIIQNDSDTDSIYRALRHTDNPYTTTTVQDYMKTMRYFLGSASKDLARNPQKYNWNITQYERGLIENNSIGIANDNPKYDWLTKNIYTFGYQHWTWSRSYKTGYHKANFHVSLNVDVKAGLLQKLDKLLIEDKGKHMAYYKFPKANFFDEVRKRHDPITIYLYDMNDDILNKIFDIAKPYARSNDGLIGKWLGKGVAVAKETTESGYSVGEYAAQDIFNIINQARQNN